MAKKETKSSSTSIKTTGSAKAVRSTNTSQSTSQKNTSSIKTLYKGLPSSEETDRSSTRESTRKSGNASRRETRSSSSEKKIYGEESSTRSTGDSSSRREGRRARQNESSNKAINSDYSTSNRSSRSSESYYSSSKEKEEEDKQDKVNVGQFVYGLAEQAANDIVGAGVGVADMFVGTPYQKALDYVEDKLKLPDLGVNAITQYNQYLQKTSKEESEKFAENASKSELASLVNQYGPDVLAILPNIALGISSGGLSTAATGTMAVAKTASAVGKASKVDDFFDAAKVAGKLIRKNPSVVSSAVQTTGRAYNQALSEGADANAATAYAFTNGLLDITLNSVGLGHGNAGMETLVDKLLLAQNAKQGLKTAVKAVAQDSAEGVVQGIAQRASRAIYDDSVKLYSENDPNAVLNHKAVAEDALMGSVGATVMSGVRAGAKVTEHTMLNQISRMQTLRYMDELIKSNEGLDKGYAIEQAELLQKLTNGIVLEPEQLRRLDMTNDSIQKLYTQKTGIAFSSMDNSREDTLRQKFQTGAVKAKKTVI